MVLVDTPQAIALMKKAIEQIEQPLDTMVFNLKYAKAEKDEFMLMLCQNGSITQKQYNEYLANGNKTNTDEIVNAALAVGAVLLIGYLISEMFKGK